MFQSAIFKWRVPTHVFERLTMAQDIVLQSLICGIGYEMTPSEEQLKNQRRPQQKQQQHRNRLNKTESMSGTMKPSQTQKDATPEEPEGRVRGSRKLRRAFSLNSYRNPFRTKSNDVEEAAVSPSTPVENMASRGSGAPEAKRRGSWRKFLLKIAAQFGVSDLIVSAPCVCVKHVPIPIPSPRNRRGVVRLIQFAYFD